MIKKSLMAIIAVTAILVGCKKEEPTSSFTTEKDFYKMKESIQFTNQSANGVSYHWDFGDGESSSLKNPGHTYLEAGEYIVTLQVQGAKKTVPAEYNKKLTILDLEDNYIEPDVLFASTVWVCDSLTDIYYNCAGDDYDNSSGEVNHSMTFYEDNTVLMLNSGTGNICDYEVLNDSLIGFFEDPYYRIWKYSLSGDRLTLTNDAVTSCPDGYPDGSLEGWLHIKHFYKQ